MLLPSNGIFFKIYNPDIPTLDILLILAISDSNMILSSCLSVRRNFKNVAIIDGSVVLRINNSKYAVEAITSSVEV